MITLGLMEGAILAALQNILLIGAIEAGAPMHRVLGPPAAILLGVAGWAVWDAGGTTPLEVAGLLTVVVLVFALPLALMRQGWHEAKFGIKAKAIVIPVPVKEVEMSAESAVGRSVA